MSKEVRATVDAAHAMPHGTMVHLWIPGKELPELQAAQQVTITIPEGKP